ncbi:MAG: hypothetical protein FJ306_05585, partial [Planctomycetes bacterium]|nr:hypothetical protein [Planctomycetota bacterium]
MATQVRSRRNRSMRSAAPWPRSAPPCCPPPSASVRRALWSRSRRRPPTSPADRRPRRGGALALCHGAAGFRPRQARPPCAIAGRALHSGRGLASFAMTQPTPSKIAGAALRARLAELWERTGYRALGELAAGRPPRPDASIASAQEFADWTATCLMAAYQRTRDDAVLALLFECNRDSFLQAIQQGLRRTWLRIDPQDVLQEVFLNICRYPTRFDADKIDAFRNWGHRIVRNTLLRALKGQARHARLRAIDEETFQPEDLHN